MKIPGKSSIPLLDECDFLKREVCSYFVSEYKSGRLSEKSKTIGLLSWDEMVLVLKFRTEYLTLDRLVDLKFNYDGAKSLESIKKEIVSSVTAIDMGAIRINSKIKEHLLAGNSEAVTLEFLVKNFPGTNLTKKLLS
jgi:hypothetical protein